MIISSISSATSLSRKVVLPMKFLFKKTLKYAKLDVIMKEFSYLNKRILSGRSFIANKIYGDIVNSNG